jgi:hypothetical protein
MVRIGFSTTESWISRLIRWFTNARVSHVFLVYDDPVLQQEMVLDVAFTGYRVLPFNLFKLENDVVEMIEPRVDLSPGLRVTARWLGKPYDWRAFIAFSRWFRSLRHQPAETPKALICTEAVVRALLAAGYPGAEGLDLKGTSPQLLLEFLRR